MNKRFLYILSAFALLFFISSDVEAQCAMCKAVAESATDEHGNHTAGGINNGILYMMGVPYLLLMVLGWVFFREKIKGFIHDFRSIHS